MCKVIEQTEDIKYNMREGWTNLITIERLIAESPFAKMPLISYGSKGQAMKSNPLLEPIGDSEFWGFSLLKI